MLKAMLVGVACLCVSGCFAQGIDSLDTNSESSPPPAQHSEKEYTYSDPTGPGFCSPEYQTFHLPNGQNIVLEIAVACEFYDGDRGDPPPDSNERLDPGSQEKTQVLYKQSTLEK